MISLMRWTRTEEVYQASRLSNRSLIFDSLLCLFLHLIHHYLTMAVSTESSNSTLIRINDRCSM